MRVITEEASVNLLQGPLPPLTSGVVKGTQHCPISQDEPPKQAQESLMSGLDFLIQLQLPFFTASHSESSLDPAGTLHLIIAQPPSVPLTLRASLPRVLSHAHGSICPG